MVHKITVAEDSRYIEEFRRRPIGAKITWNVLQRFLDPTPFDTSPE